jgi:hypothetical protein
MTDQKKTSLSVVRKPKRREDIIRQAQEAEAKLVVIPERTNDEALEARGIAVTRKMNATHLECAAAYFEIYTNKLNERRGYGRPSEYFETVIGVSWRSAQQGIAIWESALAITEGERPAARLALEQIGTYRSAVIAPAIREHPEQWAEWTSLAADKSVTREALQEQVSTARGLPPAHSKKDGDRLYNTFVGRLDAVQREEFENTYRALKLITESDDFVVNTAIAYREGKVDWLAQAERIRTGHGNA